MITLQHDVSYAGDSAKTPLKSVDIIFQVPTFLYTRSSDSSGEVTRGLASSTQSTAITQAVDAKSYQVTISETFLVGADDTTSVLAAAYESSGVQKGDVDALTVGVTVLYSSSDSQVLGQQTFDILIIPKTTFSTERVEKMIAAAASSSWPSYFAASKPQYIALRRQLAGTSVDGNDAVLLRALSFLVSLDGDIPTYLEAAAAVVGRWLDQQTQGADSVDILKLIKKNFDALMNFPLVIPEATTLLIAGTLTIVAPDGTAVGLNDFKSFEISTECRDTTGSPPRMLTFRFDDATKVDGKTAPFSLTATDPLYRNVIQDPVVVRVRGIDGAIVWSREYKSADPTLAALDIFVPIQASATLSGPPDGTRPEVSLKLRGQVVTFKTDCVLKDVLVLIQAKTSADAQWRVVGAATTDASGNFGMPYPYGTYTQARAVVSLAPQESVDIPIIAKDGDVTISDDFLYVLVNNPECPPATDAGECDCSSDGTPNRLPDFSDLIGSDEYTQDIGGSCVNLSKPNRTLSEFSFKAIVRLSDPDVANYTLTCIETGLDAIDVSLVAPLESGAIGLSIALKAAQNHSIAPPPSN